MFQTIKKSLAKFVLLWLVVFITSFFILSFFGLIPERELDAVIVDDVIEETEDVVSLEQKLALISPAPPERVVIDLIGVDVNINNPESTSINVLDDSLLTGAVRYPSSGLLGQKTNMLLFGHSSNLPIVRNTNFKAFNKLNKLEPGDSVSVFSKTHEFVYTVTTVEEADAQNALVVFESEKREITLSTCNTFGNLDDRFVVRAELIDVREI